MTRCWDVICLFEVIWWRLSKERLKRINGMPMLLWIFCCWLCGAEPHISHHSSCPFPFASGVLQHVRIKTQNSECIIVVSSDDVTPKGGRPEYVENYIITPLRENQSSLVYDFLLSQRFKTQEFGGFTKAVFWRGTLNDLPTDDPVLPGTYTHQLPRCDRLPGEQNGLERFLLVKKY